MVVSELVFESFTFYTTIWSDCNCEVIKLMEMNWWFLFFLRFFINWGKCLNSNFWKIFNDFLSWIFIEFIIPVFIFTIFLFISIILLFFWFLLFGFLPFWFFFFRLFFFEILLIFLDFSHLAFFFYLWFRLIGN